MLGLDANIYMPIKGLVSGLFFYAFKMIGL